MTGAAEDTTQDALRLAVSLRQTGRCVMRMGYIVLDLEDQLLASKDNKSSSDDSMQSLQMLDFLKQTTDDIAALLERLADAVPQNLSVNQDDILRPMKLQELRDFISETGDLIPPHDTRKSDKHIELF